MTFQRFVGVLPWSLFFSLLAAVIAAAVPKIWPLDFDGHLWAALWVGGGAAAGLLVAAIWTYSMRGGPLGAAIEIDRRFGLKERVSSTLSLGDGELDTEVGRALLDDAARQVARIDVAERFRVSASWRAVLPLAAAAAAFAIAFFVEDASRDEAAASQARLEAKKRIERSTAELKKRIAAQRRKAESLGLKDVEPIFRQLEKGVDRLRDSDQPDRQRAMIKLNDLAKDLERRRRQLGGAEQMRRQLEHMKSGRGGPAERVAEALRRGKFGQAQSELEKLKQRLQQGQLSDQEKQQLARQVEEMASKLQRAVDAHQQAKRELQRRIQERRDAGDLAGAGQLQRKLDELNQQETHMSRLQQMASRLGQCSQSLQKGNPNAAASTLGELAADLEGLQRELDELEALDEAMFEIAQAKNAMNCDQCGGGG
jgi:hypothetical protein